MLKTSISGDEDHQQKYYQNGANNLVRNASCSTAYNQNNLSHQQNTASSGQKLTPDIVREYLRTKGNCDCDVVIYQPKIAQKSYGQEKRFFCPPPMVFLRGKGWKIRAMMALGINGGETVLQQFMRINEPSGDYDYEEPVALIGIMGSKDQERHALKWQKDAEGRCAVHKLHIGDNDNNRRKYFTLSVQCFYKSGHLLGQFESKRIKVISKPSKKKNINNSGKQVDIKNQGINIASGTEVALFSRVRSQTTNTRYLFVKDGKFIAHSDFWGSFTIHLIDVREDEPIEPHTNDFHVRDGFINYGSIVKLVDSVSGLGLPMMKICKVDKQDLVNLKDSENEQVSQLHKCAFQMLDNDKHFMCFTNDQIVQQEAQTFESGRSVFKDGAQWTIISTDTTHYRFYEPAALGPIQSEISPVPIVFSLEIHASDTIPPTAYVELHGQNFYPNLLVWIGSTPVPTFLLSKEVIRFALPSLSDLKIEEGEIHQASSPDLLNEERSQDQADLILEFPLLLAREDGIIYATELFITYTRPTSIRDCNTNIVNAGIPRAQQMNL